MLDRILIARLLSVAATACGLMGLVAALTVRPWRLGDEDWFGAGILLGVLALVILFDGYAMARHDGDN
jgi:hypothetical protein